MPENILKGKNCLITGATGFLGVCITKELAGKGCNLFLTSRTPEKLEDLKTQTETEFRDIEVFYKTCNVEKNNEIYEVIEKAKSTFKTIDILINSAGIVQFDNLLNSTVDDFESMFNINVRATFIFCKELVQDMIKNNWGRIVNIGSTSAYNGFANSSLYCSSKHAVLGFTRSLFKELINYNVRPICISFGTLLSEMGEEVTRKYNLKPDTFIDPKEVAEYIVFTISFDGQMVSNEVLLNRIHE
jgi:3-oxoacyl-[acyl-carrier protein] reductase